MFKSFTDRLPALGTPGKGEVAEVELPVTMQWAVKLMLVGAAISTVFLVFAAIVTSNVKSSLLSWNATLPKGKQYTTSQITDAANSYIATTIIIGLIAIALWLFMARMNRSGRNWARITATVFFVLWTYYTYVSIGQTRGSSTFIAALVLVLAIWVVGLASLILLWRPPSIVTGVGWHDSRRLLSLASPLASLASHWHHIGIAEGGLLVADVVLAAVPTPFTPDGEVDTAAASRLFGFIAEVVDGLFVAGTTGEFPALDDDERLALIEAGLSVAGPERVIAHIGAPDSRRAARLAAAATALGATRIAAITPFYLAPRPDEVTAYYDRIRQAAPSAGLYSYIYPERTGLAVAPDQFASLAAAVGLAGAKFSGAAARNVAACAVACPGLKIFSGDDSDLAATLRAGGAGIISARSSAFPEVFAALSAALAAGDADAAARHHDEVTAILSTGASIGAVKEALRLRGFDSMGARMPVGVPDEATAARIAELVKALAPSNV